MKRITNINNKNVITIENEHVIINCMIYDVKYSVNYSSNVTLYNLISNELKYLEKNIDTIGAILNDKDGASDA